MKNKKFVFAGNRSHVLEAMIEKGLDIVKIFAVKNSYLERYLNTSGIAFETIKNKTSLIQSINLLEFDYFISNGLPHILPISKIKIAGKEFINIHPSFLPDLRGADPVPGAILFGKHTGATCHVMNDKIDDGDIIDQIEYKYDPNWDIIFLYQISFLLEKHVFIKSLEKNFKPLTKQKVRQEDIYYTFQEKDLEIDFDEDPDIICQRIKAFNNQSKGAYFIWNGSKLIVKDSSVIIPFKDCRNCFKEKQIVFCIENNLCIYIKDKFLYLKNIEGNISSLKSKNIQTL